ncbi:pyridoxamine 5'-phosphate oxidase family protein [Haloferax sp. DFSO52]|uniref:pyridoxamine 5'-phosphate oxidase family protein n=1 Tax=Haloferax sp. DFSO52 TaxID=3388505 RepID=UPI003A86CC32
MNHVPDEIVRLVSSEPLMAHLATCSDGRPHVAPVWFDYHEEDESIELLTAGRKLENIGENPRVSLSIQKDVDGDAQWRVTMLGTATVIESEDAIREATSRINEKYDAGDESWPENKLVRISIGTATSEVY